MEVSCHLFIDVKIWLNYLLVAEKMSKTPENDTSTEVQDNSLLETDDKQESCLTSNSAHIEVPVGSLTVQDTSVENPPDELQLESHRSGTEEVDETERDGTGDDDDNMNVVERREEPTDETITNMSVQVRSGAQVSVACGEGAEEVSNDEHNVKSRTNIKRASPVFQYSSDAAATGLCGTARIFVR